MNVQRRRGFTLVELLVVVVLGGFIVLATYQVLVTNSRTYAVNNAQIQGQQMLRAGMDVLFGELREFSTDMGDLISMGRDSLKIRAQRSFGVVCGVDYTVTPPEITTMVLGTPFEERDSIWVFHDNNPARALDDEWFLGTIRTVDNSGVCPDGSRAQILGIPMLAVNAAAADPDTVRMGAPVRGFDTYTYGLYVIDGEPFLGRRLSTASSPDPLVGPLLPRTGVAFRYLDSLGVATANPLRVAQIEVTLRYQSGVRNSLNQLVADSIVARVYPRN